MLSKQYLLLSKNVKQTTYFDLAGSHLQVHIGDSRIIHRGVHTYGIPICIYSKYAGCTLQYQLLWRNMVVKNMYKSKCDKNILQVMF